MAKNFRQEGKRIPLAASGAAIASGELVLVNDLPVVALGDIADGETGTGATEGVFELEGKVAATAINAGQKVYWDADGDPQGGTAGTGCITNVATDNTYLGIAWKDAVSTAATVEVKINA